MKDKICMGTIFIGMVSLKGSVMVQVITVPSCFAVTAAQVLTLWIIMKVSAHSEPCIVYLCGWERDVRILLNQSEFNEVVSWFECPLKLHPNLLHLTFELTVGHTGVVIELLHMISC
jgi:hypothetical protein